MGGKRRAEAAPSPAADGKALKSPLAESWGGAANVFYFLRMTESAKKCKGLDAALSPLLPLADLRLAVSLILLSGAMLAVIAFATTFISMQLANFATDMFSQVTGIPTQSLTPANLVPIAIYQLIMYLPLNILITVAYEALAFGLIRISGGSGTFTQQLYMTSVSGLAMSMITLLSLAAPLPCLGILAGIALIIATLYVLFYVNPKIYVMVHRIGFGHALLITIVLTVPKLLVLAFASNYLAIAMGFPAPVLFPGGG